MLHRFSALMAGIAVVATAALSGQTPARRRAHADGQPDLQGVWNFSTSHRSNDRRVHGQRVSDRRRAAQYEKQTAERSNRDSATRARSRCQRRLPTRFGLTAACIARKGQRKDPHVARASIRPTAGFRR